MQIMESPGVKQNNQKITRDNITKHLIEYQLKIIGKTYEEAMITENWFSKWTITKTQYDEFKKYAIPLLKKVFKFNKTKALKTFDWFDLYYGLKVKN